MKNPKSDTSPAKLLARELQQLRREFRATLRAYAARLEIDLAECAAYVANAATTAELPKARLHEIRDLAAFVRKRKVKPEKGRRKDLRKLDAIITDLHAAIHPRRDR